MDSELLAALRTPGGAAALASASAVAGGDQLVAACALRSTGIEAALASAALTQVDLRRRAVAKFGADAAGMYFTRSGLEQATRREVADRRAGRLARSGTRSIVDLGCGIGADAFAFARAGIRVDAVDADPLTAAIAASNVDVLGLRSMIRVACATAEGVDLSGADAAFCDPARRRGGGRIFDPDAFSPPWDFVVRLAETVPATVLKLAPGIDHSRIPPGAEAEWVSVDGDVVEAAFWCGPLARVARRATVARGAHVHEITGTGAVEADVGSVRSHVYDPDGAVVRAHLVAEFAASVGGVIADPTIAYVYSDAPASSPFGRCYRIEEVMPFSLKRLRAALRARGVGRLTIKKRGSALEPERLRRDLKLRGDTESTIILTRVDGAPTVLLCQPAGN